MTPIIALVDHVGADDQTLLRVGDRLEVVADAEAAIALFHADRVGVGFVGSGLLGFGGGTLALLACLLQLLDFVYSPTPSPGTFAGGPLAGRRLPGRERLGLDATLLPVLDQRLRLPEVTLQGRRVVMRSVASVAGLFGAVEADATQRDKALGTQSGHMLDEEGVEIVVVVGVEVGERVIVGQQTAAEPLIGPVASAAAGQFAGQVNAVDEGEQPERKEQPGRQRGLAGMALDGLARSAAE